MKTFIEIFNGKDGAQVAAKVNTFAQEQGVEIVNATSFMWQGVIYTTAVFKEAPLEHSVIKEELEKLALQTKTTPKTRSKKESAE